MAFVNVGALINNERPPTKKALKDALKDAPDTVVFDATALKDEGKRFAATEIPDGVTLVLVGPDPYKARKWYGNVKRGKDGTPRLT